MKSSGRMNFFVKLSIIALICFCITNIVRLQFEYNNLRDTAAELEKRKAEYEASIDKLKAEQEDKRDEDYIKRIAREKLNYYLPDEIVFYNNR